MKIKSMLLWSFVLALILSFFLIRHYRKISAPEIPVLISSDGKVLDASELKGKVFIISYFQTWCKDCIKEQPQLVQLIKHFGKDKLRILMVSDEPEEKIKRFTEIYGVELEYFHTNEALKSDLGVKAFPTTVLYGKDAQVSIKKVEGINWYTPEIIENIEKLLK
ncbi:MAG TPA: TlpA disulfide reductase family protein [Bacteroidia bacterium]